MMASRMMGVVLHVPHASTHVPDDARSGIVLDDAGLAAELLASTDHHTEALVGGLDRRADGRVRTHVHRVSRLVVDPERFLDPSREATESVGRGAVYTRGHDGRVLRDADDPGWPGLRDALIAQHFVPHHAGIERMVADLLAQHGACTVIDVHSYPRDVQPYELDATGERPELCIGTDPAHTPPALVDVVTRAAADLGLGVALDTPFSGTFVPTPWLGDARVRSVMLEIRRDTYMDEVTGAAHPGIGRARALVRRVVDETLAAS
jgi:N-formylglutamate deformylase